MSSSVKPPGSGEDCATPKRRQTNNALQIPDVCDVRRPRHTSVTPTATDGGVLQLHANRIRKLRNVLDMMTPRSVGSHEGTRSSLLLGESEAETDPDCAERCGGSHGSRGGNGLLTRYRASCNRSISRKRRTGFFGNFRKIAKFLTIFIGLWRKHVVKVREFMDSNIQLIHFDVIDDLMFDVTEFTAEKSARISEDTKRILRKEPRTRTEGQIHYVEVALRNYPSIAAYPVKIQTRIAQKAWYERYVGHRIIIRQGHVARCFYFILAGSVVVTQIEEGSKMSRTLCYLHRGHSFGELGLVRDEPRSATVISEGTVELLVFGDEDYMDMFMSSGLKNTSDTFLSGISCLQGWPIDRLADDTEKALMCFFKRGKVLVTDSNRSDWIYIVKSGSCSLLKRLDQVQPLSSTRKKRRKSRLQALEPMEHLLYLEGVIQAEEGSRTRMQRFSRVQGLRELGLRVPTHPLPGLRASADTVEQGSIITRIGRPWFAPPSKLDQQEVSADTGPGGEDSASARALAGARSVRGSGVSLVLPPVVEGPQKEHAVFVTVQTLVKGDVFGLADLLHGDQPSFSLVSNGAECVLIDKRFYWDHAPQALTRTLRNEVCPYPADAQMQYNLGVTEHWELHKTRVFTDTLAGVRRKKQLQRQCRGKLIPFLRQ